MNRLLRKDRKFAYDASIDRLLAFHIPYVILLIVIAVLETVMIVRSAFIMTLSKTTHLVYFVSYIVLFTFSVLTAAALLYNKKRRTMDRFVYRLINVYGAVILLWSAAISLVDVVRGNTMIVFLTVIMVVAAILDMNSILYTVVVGSASVVLIVQAAVIESHLTDSSGYFINFAVFVVFSILLKFIQSRWVYLSFVDKQKLERLSYCDQLTGVYNRHSLKEYISSMKEKTIFYFGIIDMDNFKRVNDTFGHDIGDQCLKMLAEQLCASFGKHIFRFGGDEFVVVTTQRESDLGEHVDKINAAFAERYPDLEVHISAGFYCPVSDDEEYEDYLRKADEALYAAKNTGKKKAVIYKAN